MIGRSLLTTLHHTRSLPRLSLLSVVLSLSALRYFAGPNIVTRLYTARGSCILFNTMTHERKHTCLEMRRSIV